MLEFGIGRESKDGIDVEFDEVLEKAETKAEIRC